MITRSSPNSSLQIRVHSPADTAVDPMPWRDARIKDCLCRTLSGVGHQLVCEGADIDIWIWGWTARAVDPEARHVFWAIGHPDMLQKNLPHLRRLNARNCSASKSFAEFLDSAGLASGWLPCPAPISPKIPYEPTHQVAFVGNSDQAKKRPCLVPVFKKFKSLVYGPWQDLATAGLIPWNQMHEPWNRALVVPYSHHRDMAVRVFVADAALDVIVNSEALLLSDKNEGRNHLGIPVPQWGSPKDLLDLVEYYCNNETERLLTAERCRTAASAMRSWAETTEVLARG